MITRNKALRGSNPSPPGDNEITKQIHDNLSLCVDQMKIFIKNILDLNSRIQYKRVHKHYSQK